MMEIKKTPGRLLAEAIGRLGWTNARLEEEAGLSKSFVAKVVNCRAPISTGTALRLEKAIGELTNTTAEYWATLWVEYEIGLRRRGEAVPGTREFTTKQAATRRGSKK